MRTSVEATQPAVLERLRRVILADGLVSGSMAILLIAAAHQLGNWFGLPVAFVRWTGLLLVPFAIAVLFLATRSNLPRIGVQAVIALNVGWVVASGLVLISGWIDPSGSGVAFIVVQALLVALFAGQQHVGLKQASAE
jgi:hypothetical protein